jgi:hypothetical protein
MRHAGKVYCRRRKTPAAGQLTTATAPDLKNIDPDAVRRRLFDFYQNFPYGLKPLQSGRLPLDAGQRPACLLYQVAFKRV